MEVMILTGSVIFFSILVILKGIKIVPQNDICIVERLGKYNCELHGGLNIIIPF
ncbi:MAG: paraslipin, partial [Epsilonproteobacteria bacterium]